MARFQLNRMPTYVRNKLQMCSGTQHQCRRRQMCGNVHTLIHYTHFWTVKKNDLFSLNNPFMARFQLIRMSTYAKIKLQMCSVTQHQCRSRQMCGKCSHINSLHWLLDCYRKWLVFTEQSIHEGFKLNKMCSVKLQTVQSLNISVDDAKCVENVHFHSLFVTDLSWKIISWVSFIMMSLWKRCQE